jgi:hypothetical protein
MNMNLGYRYCKYNKSGLNRTRCTIRGRPDIDECIMDQPDGYTHECDNWRYQGTGLTKEQILRKIVMGKKQKTNKQRPRK